MAETTHRLMRMNGQFGLVAIDLNRHGTMTRHSNIRRYWVTSVVCPVTVP